MKPDEITIDSLFDADPGYDSARELSAVSQAAPKEHYQYGLRLHISAYEVKHNVAPICRIHLNWSRLFSAHPDITAVSEIVFIGEYDEEPYKRTHYWPYGTLDTIRFTGILRVRFDADFRDARALCRFFSALSHTTDRLILNLSIVGYKPGSDEELWRCAYISNKTLYTIDKSLRHEVIYLNGSDVEPGYIKLYNHMWEICTNMFPDRMQTYRRLKTVFDGTEPPYYYNNVKKAANRHIGKDGYIAGLFTTKEFSDKLEQTEIDFHRVKSLDGYSFNIYMCPLMSEVTEEYPLSHPNINYALRQITGGTMHGHIDDIHIFQSGDEYVFAGCIGTFVNNDFGRSIQQLIITARGQMHRKSNTFAKNLATLFGDSCRNEINTYVQLIKRKK